MRVKRGVSQCARGNRQALLSQTLVRGGDGWHICAALCCGLSLPERFHVSVTLSAVFDLALDSTFAGCRIEAVAGRGGMGVVYRATQLGLDRPVALKLVAPERAADANFRARFDREARVAAAIEHPNVIPVYGCG